MKHTSLAALAAASLVSLAPVAQASDLGLAGPSYDWSGGYVGLDAGAAFENTSISDNYRYTGFATITPELQSSIDSLGINQDSNDTAFTGGVVAGYNWQYASFVLGVEGDFNYLNISGNASRDVSGVMDTLIAPPTRGTENVNFEANWYGTVRARAGYAIDNVLIYGTGGLAYGDLDVNQSLRAGNGRESVAWSGSSNGWNLGWTAGGGIEYGVDHWVLGAEYLYVDLGSYGWDSSGFYTSPSGRVSGVEIAGKGTADYAFGVARATLKYRF